MIICWFEFSYTMSYFSFFPDCQSACPDELGGRMGVPHVAIVPIKAPISSQKEIIAGEERPKYFTANKIDNNNHDPGQFRYIL